jgi:micrococcal nuclease
MWRVLAAMVLGASGALAAAPPCAGDIEIGKANIMRVEANGVLVLTDGRALHLEGIRLPTVHDHAPQAIADAAFTALSALAKGQMLDARAVYPKEDRYDRVRAQVFAADGTWLQIEMLKRGLARVDIAPDRGECNGDLYDAERQARHAGLGLWALPEFAFRTPENVGADMGTFQVVMAWVKATGVNEGRVYLNFGADWRTDFTVTISPDDMKTFRRMGVDPLLYQGRLIIVRGIVQSQGGPEIEVGNPKQIELVQ